MSRTVLELYLLIPALALIEERLLHLSGVSVVEAGARKVPPWGWGENGCNVANLLCLHYA